MLSGLRGYADGVQCRAEVKRERKREREGEREEWWLTNTLVATAYDQASLYMLSGGRERKREE